MGEKDAVERGYNVENRLRRIRGAKEMSQETLAGLAGITRQAVCAIETNQYLPTTGVALRLARALDCRVEDLFGLMSTGEVIEGDWLGAVGERTEDEKPVRVKVARVGTRLVVRPVAMLGDLLNYTTNADGLLMEGPKTSRRGAKPRTRVKVELLRDRLAIEQEITVAGCDPAISLAGEYLRRKQDRATLIDWNCGSVAAVEALKQGEVHMAGLHIVDAKSGESNLPYLRRHLKAGNYTVITFAHWEEGLIVRKGNPKGIRQIEDLVRKGVTIINREPGAGARVLIDQQLANAGISATQVKGYDMLARSHWEVARRVAEGAADVGIGICSAARFMELTFIPLQTERYDLVVRTEYLEEHPGLTHLLDTIVSRPFRLEIDALGGYDTRDTGKVQELKTA